MAFSKIDADSQNTITSALNFFELPSTNVSISHAAFREYLTLNPISSTPYNFKVHATSSYLDLSKCYILTEMQVTKKDTDTNKYVALDDKDLVAPIQMIGSTFIKNLKVSINGRETFDSNSLYAYKSYMSTELSFPKSAKNSHLNAAGYYSDEGDQNSASAKGIVARSKLFAGSKVAQFISKIDADVFNQDLFLLSNVELDLEITPNDASFMLIAPKNDAPEYKIEIQNCRLFIKTLDLMDGLNLDIARRLEQIPARYALRKTMTKSIFIEEGRTELFANLFTEITPRRIVCGLIANDAYSGSKKLSPFKFDHFNVREITITANGYNYPAVPYNLDFANDKYVRAFYDMNENLGLTNNSENNGISLKEYKEGWCIYVQNLTRSLDDHPCFDLLSSGTTGIGIRFSAPVPKGGITLICMAEQDSILVIDKHRTITSDATV